MFVLNMLYTTGVSAHLRARAHAKRCTFCSRQNSSFYVLAYIECLCVFHLSTSSVYFIDWLFGLGVSINVHYMYYLNVFSA